ncbi:MAG: alkylhydroperoxidase [Dehalococcoidia bacterium SM23_28_2]|nr:MAG: alkylhydroperoxidase [Dehalococcoidia bacterium SM23_28_2]
MERRYPEYREHLHVLARKLAKQIPGPISRIGQLHRDSVADGALSTKVKELMAMAIAIAIQCDGCISHHAYDALRAGATTQEIAEAIGVAVLMGGGPAVVYGSEALEAVEQFQGVL